MPLHSSCSVETVQYPDRSTRQTSTPLARRSTILPSASRRTSKPTYSHPADRGVIPTTLPSTSGFLLLLKSRSLTLPASFLEVTALRPPGFCVLLAGGDDGVYLRDLRHGHVPEGLVSRNALVAVHGDMDDDRSLHTLRVLERTFKLAGGLRPEHTRAEALCVGGEVHGE